MLGDVVGGIVACAGGSTTTIMPAGADPHDFAPSSATITAMLRADLVVANGLGFEAGLTDAITSAAHDGARIFEVAARLDPIPFGEAGREGGHDAAHEGHSGASQDPHFWHDVARMATAARLIAAELGRIRGDTETFDRCGQAAVDTLTALDSRVREILDTVPADRRVLITDHEALGYLAAAYHFTVAGVVIPGGSTLAVPSSSAMAALIRVIRTTGIPVIFSNSAGASDVVSTVAHEAGTRVRVVPLFVESLGKRGSPARTYQGMVLTNASRIASALAG
jgi:zinc/manganese transport system substrate-binding protein